MRHINSSFSRAILFSVIILTIWYLVLCFLNVFSLNIQIVSSVSLFSVGITGWQYYMWKDSWVKELELLEEKFNNTEVVNNEKKISDLKELEKTSTIIHPMKIQMEIHSLEREKEFNQYQKIHSYKNEIPKKTKEEKKAYCFLIVSIALIFLRIVFNKFVSEFEIDNFTTIIGFISILSFEYQKEKKIMKLLDLDLLIKS